MTQRFRRGLVVGKFCPLHRGHMLLIDSALEACDEVFVISYTNPEFAGCGPAVREGWLAALYPQVRSVVLEDRVAVPLPHNDAPEADHRSFVGWICRELLNTEVDAVFTSEDYGDGFAAALNGYFGAAVAHVCVDKARGRVPVSGTAIRRNPHAYREFLDPRVYASFVKRVAILGGESSGKTTLACDLATALGTVWAPEYGRERWIATGGDLSFEDMREIGQEQVWREERLAQQATQWLVCDTTPLTTLCYSLDKFGAADPVLEHLAERRYDAVIVCTPDFPFIQDGTRRDTDFQSMQQKWYQIALDKRQIAYTVVAGPREERVRRATSLLQLQTPS